MVFESIIPVKSVERKPWEMLPIAFIFATISTFLALWIFPSQAALVAVFLTTLACLPLMINVISFEKEREEHSKDYIKDVLLSIFIKLRTHPDKEHSAEKILPFFVYMFLGLALAVTFWFAVLPQNLVNDLFYVQINTIKSINVNISGGTLLSDYFNKILLNNVKVLSFCILFSFVYGAGAIFILAWNASVIGVAMGESIRKTIAASAQAVGLPNIASYSSAVSFGLLRYLLHGIPEILAYFIGGLAGGIISIAVMKESSDSNKFKMSMIHAAELILIAIFVLIIAALIEVFISPHIRAS